MFGFAYQRTRAFHMGVASSAQAISSSCAAHCCYGWQSTSDPFYTTTHCYISRSTCWTPATLFGLKSLNKYDRKINLPSRPRAGLHTSPSSSARLWLSEQRTSVYPCHIPQEICRWNPIPSEYSPGWETGSNSATCQRRLTHHEVRQEG